MSRFVKRITERVDLGDGDWVEIRTRFTYGDRMALQEKLLGLSKESDAVRMNTSGEVVEDTTLHLAAANLEVLARAIVAWGGPGFCALEHDHASGCTPRPITAENIEALDETGERILDEIERRRVKRTADFTKPPAPSTADTAAATGDSSSSPSSAATAGAGPTS